MRKQYVKNTVLSVVYRIVRGHKMAALIAIGLVFGVFAILNLIEFKRLD